MAEERASLLVESTGDADEVSPGVELLQRWRSPRPLLALSGPRRALAAAAALGPVVVLAVVGVAIWHTLSHEPLADKSLSRRFMSAQEATAVAADPPAQELPGPQFDCNAGLTNWKLGWSDQKKSVCCQQEQKGCEEAPPPSEPFDCEAGFSNWRDGWSENKKQWCCDNKQKGCGGDAEAVPPPEVAAPPIEAVPPAAVVAPPTEAATPPVAPAAPDEGAGVATAAPAAAAAAAPAEVPAAAASSAEEAPPAPATATEPAEATPEAPAEDDPSFRVCVDLPGVQLSDTAGLGSDEKATTAKQCTQSCQKRDDCRQVIFSAGNNGCYLFSEAGDEVSDFQEIYNSSYCGPKSEEPAMMEMLHKAYAHQADFPPPIVECSFSGDDCSKTKCCNDVSCDLNFTKCVGYTCYKKSEYFAGCLLEGPPGDWEGSTLGGPRETREIAPAAEGAKVQGTKLFCFMVVSWDAPPAKEFWSSERELAEHIKEHHLSIFQCDEHAIFDGAVTDKAQWGSFSNIDMFLNIWKEVKKDGRYEDCDWVVKVDSDAVFFPQRLKTHINALRTPKGARVYLKNIDYQFKFMGALEVMTKEALKLFFEKGDACSSKKHDGGEDYFLSLCLDSIGVDHQTDYKLLRDKYCMTCTDVDHNHCTDGEAAAYHFHKKIISWDWCYNQAVCGDAYGNCDGGLKVEFVMPHVA